MLEYASDAHIPGITNNENGALRFLDGLDVDLKDGDGEWRCWVDLTEDERSTVSNELFQYAVSRKVSSDRIDRLFGTAYTLTDEPKGTELRDVSEFSTLLNATARYERADVGLAVCLGYRDEALEQARTLLSNHRKNLSEGLQYVKREGVTEEQNVQWFHAEDEIRETIVGIIAGMAVGSDGIDRGTPIIAFAEKTDEDGDEPGEVKVSARATPSLTRKGLDLSVVMREASQSVGGDGGGHNVAAGATVPKGTEAEFVDLADELVGEQLG
jgi:RecJ-like exonuclease